MTKITYKGSKYKTRIKSTSHIEKKNTMNKFSLSTSTELVPGRETSESILVGIEKKKSDIFDCD